jgi:hypothetical protein
MVNMIKSMCLNMADVLQPLMKKLEVLDKNVRCTFYCMYCTE